MESGESKKRLIRSSQQHLVYTNSTTSEYRRGQRTPEKDPTMTSPTHTYNERGDADNGKHIEHSVDGDLQSHGISIVDTKTKNFSNVTPEEVSDYYKSLGEWQNILPKTDYTYSPMSQYYTKKINGKIPIIPNMCRRNIWKINGAEVQENELNLFLAENYEYERKYGRRMTANTEQTSVRRILRRISTVTVTLVRTVIRRVSMVHTEYSRSVHATMGSQAWANSLKNLVLLVALALMIYYFILGGDLIQDKYTSPFISLFGSIKNLVYYFYDLTWSSTTFLTSLISGCATNVAHTANTVVFLPLYSVLTQEPVKPEHTPRQSTSDDVEAAIRRWFDQNAQNIARKVIGTDEFVDFINDRFRKHNEDEKARFDEYLKGYDFGSTELAEKLRRLESQLSEWRDQLSELRDHHRSDHLDELKVRLEQLRDHVMTKDERMQTEILTIISLFVGGDGSSDDLRRKFDSLVRTLNETRVKIDALTADFDNYTKNASDNATSNEQLLQELGYSLKLSVEEMIAKRMQEWKQTMTQRNSVNSDKIDVAEKYVEDAIKRALEIYDADKTGKPDFALESQGGIILSTRCTETKTANAQFSIFGIPLWHSSRTPRTVIQPGVHPGECWAFPGSTGYLVIQLSERILITGFTMEHIPRSLAANGTIDSAPKDFSVWALKWESDPEPRFLGEFQYSDKASSVQYFEAIRLNEPYQIVELKILSNHGKMDYTCLYRFRVHGIPY